MNTRQIVLLEILFLANLAVLAALGVIALGEGRIQIPGALSHSNPGIVAYMVIKETTANAPASTIPPTLASTLTLPPTQSPSSSHTPTPVQLGRALLPSATLAPTLTAPTVLLDIIGHGQSLPLSCESRSAADWASYFGVAIDELEFLGRLPISDNPEIGFVGDVNGNWGKIPPDSYGVHAGPVAASWATMA